MGESRRDRRACGHVPLRAARGSRMTEASASVRTRSGARPSRRDAMRLLALAPAFGAATPAAAAGWPERAVTVVSPYAPGGGSDIIARAVAKELGAVLGQPFVVENRSGAAGSVGAALVARARPDGYTMLVGGSSPI